MAELLEGLNPVMESLKAGRKLSKIMISRNTVHKHGVLQLVDLAKIRGVVVEKVPGEALDRMSRTGAHQGIIAIMAAAREYYTLDELLKISQEKAEAPLYCILDGIEDPHNLGAIIRTAEASGIHGVVIRAHRAAGITPVVAKASSGAIEYLPVVQVPNITQAIEKLKKNNVWVTGIEGSGETEYTQIDYKGPTAIVIGSEGNGISDLVKKHCDFLAHIPMRGRITSLNASVAAGLVMYEALRQRAAKA